MTMWPFRKQRRIYLDYASATPVLPEALRAQNAAGDMYGNPGSIHAEGVLSREMLEKSRETIARQLACKSREIVYVSGGTEANNLAIVGYARKLESIRRTLTGTHWIVAKIEHPSVLECFAEIERMGGSVTHVDVDARGRMRSETLAAALTKETVFVSIGWANHEIGTIQDMSDLARVINAHEEQHHSIVIFHCDAGQTPLYKSPYVHTLGVDLLTLDSGKLYGPRGIGALYISNRTELAPIFFGGKQERGLRAGTENVALAAGFATAFETVARERASESKRVRTLRNQLEKEITQRCANVFINGDTDHTLPHMLNISIKDVDCEYLTLALDRRGIAVATKSACREGEESRSHVVDALGGESWRAAHTIRMSLGRDTTTRDIQSVAVVLDDEVTLYRSKKMI